MKNRNIKLASLVILITLAVTGCGRAEGDKKVMAKSQKKIKIEYWHVNAETQGGNTVDKLVKDFNGKSKDIEVVSKYNPDMYKGLMQNLQAEAAAGKAPALVQIGWAFLDYFSNNFKYVEPQKVIDENFTEDKNFLKDNFLSNILSLAKNSSGEQVGIPYSLSTPVLYINKDLFRKAGVDENGPKTWEQVVEFSNKIKEKTGKYGFYLQEPEDNWATEALLESNGAKMLTDGKATFASEDGIKAYQIYADMIVKTKSALHISWDEGVKSFIDGNVGMLYTTIAQRENIQKSASFDVAAVNSPSWEGKQAQLPAGGCFLAITAQNKADQIAAWKFEKYLYSVKSMAEWTKGTGYVPPRKDVADDPDGLKDFLQQNKMMAAATTQMDKVVPWTSFPGDAGLQAEQILLDTRDKILGGKVSARNGLVDAQNKINELLAK
ncbi:ABC transporter substrate-binding protein [Clostridium oryzae]|uniref:sn-glycerol-3-phosphate-binding periplasmic protein UgpB n=1 Tax=Clostridium oryzae TaxID=1450648 RepID=A0A1V4IFW9_9CLOT|nr:ABC transporter substrate-binding protein [Clostridium oryzae]OPJ58555.1 sn-glycerol-3-phosphate-binding periplasmic protein UgpB precursor [Clostridium oryzae]